MKYDKLYKEMKLQSFQFTVEREKCIKCGKCMKTCSSGIIEWGQDGYPQLKEGVDGIVGWSGCYRCQHCLAVCPQGAISMLGKKPENSVLPVEAANAKQLEALMRNRRAIRRYLDKEVPREVIDEMLCLLENVPTGSNNQTLNFQVVYKKEEMDKLRKLVRDRAFELAEQGIYPEGFTKKMFDSQVALEPHRNPGDMFFVNAPHLLIIHSKKDIGLWQIDPVLAMAWFDLICASRGIGSVMLTFPVRAIAKMPDVQALLGISDDRYYCAMMAFGYPEIEYARGVQREGIAVTTELTF
jgi:ferredoxin